MCQSEKNTAYNSLKNIKSFIQTRIFLSVLTNATFHFPLNDERICLFDISFCFEKLLVLILKLKLKAHSLERFALIKLTLNTKWTSTIFVYLQETWRKIFEIIFFNNQHFLNTHTNWICSFDSKTGSKHRLQIYIKNRFLHMHLKAIKTPPYNLQFVNLECVVSRAPSQI